MLICLLVNSNCKENLNSYTIYTLKDLSETYFNLTNKIVVLKYVNDIQRVYNSSINFVFRYGEKSSTKVYIYDSLDKINQTENGFVDYLNETTLKGKQILKISYEEPFYKDNSIYYIVLYDNSQQYSDYVYVVNSLKDSTFENEFSFKLNCSEEITFNFMIQKSTSTYLHYQTSGTTTTIYYYNNYFITIRNDKGEKVIYEYGSGISGYVYIEPNRKYYAQITIKHNTITAIRNKPEFLLNYEEYRGNILLQDNSEIYKRILYRQHFYFFKDISDLNIGQSITFKINIGSGNIYQTTSFYFKLYTSNNFDSLIRSFPYSRNGFGNQIITNSTNNFTLKVRKKYKTDKGLLFGVFIENDGNIVLVPNYLILKAEKSNETEEKITESSYSESQTLILLIAIVGFIIVIIIISLFIYWCYLKSKRSNRNRSNYIQPQQNFQNNQYPPPPPNNNYNNYNNINNNYDNSGVNNNNTGTDSNNNDNKIETKSEPVYDPPITSINES